MEDDVQAAYDVLERLRQAGIDLDEVTQQLEDEGVEKFSEAFDKLIQALESEKARS